MAYWIVENRGLCGFSYKCSKCRRTWLGLRPDNPFGEKCPNCNSSMTEYKRKEKENDR